MLSRKAKFHRVSASSEERIVINLVGIPIQHVFRDTAQSSVQGGESGNIQLRCKHSWKCAKSGILGQWIDRTHRCRNQGVDAAITDTSGIHQSWIEDMRFFHA